ncbi:MAG: RNA methyltransferase [Bacteroidetes bacterium]|nr:RNA methyltransferase [Bacteroidota bacterium]
MNSTLNLSNVKKQQLYSFLSGFISENKKNKFEEIILQRTRYITVVLEDIFQPHNASAVLRSCDCFGIQDVHIIENNNKYEINPDVALGSSKWLTLYKYSAAENNTIRCLQELKDSGYRIIATTPHKHDHTPEALPLDQKIALVFGTELEGLTPQAIEMADGFVKIPMYGFTESLNISVSAALLVRSLTGRLRNSGIPWQLSETDSLDIRIAWAKSVVKKADLIEKEFFRKTDRGN